MIDTIEALLGRPWYDSLLLVALAAFFMFEGLLLWRGTRLGWAMTAKCAAMFCLFGVGLTLPLIPAPYRDDTLTVVRVLALLGLGWAVAELIRMRRRRQRFQVIENDDFETEVDAGEVV